MRDEMVDPVSRDRILRRERGQEEDAKKLCSADHELDWQQYPIDFDHTLLKVVTTYMHTYIHTYIHT